MLNQEELMDEEVELDTLQTVIKMPHFEEGTNGEIILIGDDFDLKMDNQRLVYIDEGQGFKKMNDKPAVPIGFDKEEKKYALEQIYTVIEQR